MAFARDSYTATAAQTDFTITFPYLSQDDVVVTVDGTLKVVGASNDYTFSASTTIKFVVAMTGAETVILKRSTSQSTRLVNYTAGPLAEADLDNDSLQGFYMAQEAIDTAATALGLDSTDNWDAESKLIKNLLTPANSTDAVTKAYVDALTILAGNVPTPDDPDEDNYVLRASSGSFSWKEEVFINVKTDFAALGDGSTDDWSKIEAAINAAAVAGGGTVFFPAGGYALSSFLNVSAGEDHVRLLGEGRSRSYLIKPSSVDTEILRVGNFTTSIITSEGNTLLSNAASGAITVTVASGKGTNFSAGEDAVLWFDTILSAAKINKTAEFINIFSISGDVLTLSGPLTHAYTTAANAEIYRVNWVDGFEVDNLGFDGNSHATAGGSVNSNNLVECYWARRPVFKDIGMWEAINFGLGLGGCLDARVLHPHFRDFLSDGIQSNSGSFGYGVVELGLNEGLLLDSPVGDRVRHVYTTAVLGVDLGEPHGSRIVNGVARNCRGAGFDTHAQGRDIMFSNCQTIGSLAHGFQDRATRTVFDNCMARDCIGAAMFLSTDSDNARINSFRYIKTNLGTWNATDWTATDAIVNNGTDTSFDRLEVIDFTPLWSDAITSGNLASVSGSVGRCVVIEGYAYVNIQANNIDTSGMTGSNALFIQALPYTIRSGIIAAGTLRMSQVKFGDSSTQEPSQLTPTITSGTVMTLRDQIHNTSGTDLLVNELNTGTADLFISIVYPIAL